MSTYEARLAALREQLKADRLDGFVVPLTDEHMSEYVGSYAQRLAWLTGFQGSAGSAVVLPEEAAIFVDGRYTLQVRDQVDGNHWSYQSVPETSIADWLKVHAPDGGRIGYDPWLHTKDWVTKAREALADKGAELVAVRRNPIDAVWADQPEPSRARLIVHPDEFAGRSSAAKRQEMADWLKEQKADAAVLAALDSIAWTFNVRGKDVEHTPVALSFALVHDDGTADLFVASEKIGDDVRQHLGNGVRVHERERFRADAGELAGKTVAVDPSARWRRSSRRWRRPARTSSPGATPRSCPRRSRTRSRSRATRAAQARDGAALSRFLHWLSIEAPKGGLDELKAARGCRASARPAATCAISASTPFRAPAPTARSSIQGHRGDQPADRDGFDLPRRSRRPISGRHDRRHPHRGVGTPTAEMKDRFTRVLQGHIGVARALFPKEPAARSWTASPASFSGAPEWITPTAPAMAWAASSPSTKGRSASRRSAAPSPAATSRSRA